MTPVRRQFNLRWLFGAMLVAGLYFAAWRIAPAFALVSVNGLRRCALALSLTAIAIGIQMVVASLAVLLRGIWNQFR